MNSKLFVFVCLLLSMFDAIQKCVTARFNKGAQRRKEDALFTCQKKRGRGKKGEQQQRVVVDRQQYSDIFAVPSTKST